MQNRIREIRRERRLTMEQLAELADTSPQQIGKLERGERRLTVDWVARLAKALNVPAGDFIDLNAPRGLAEPQVVPYDAGADKGFEQRLLGTLYPGHPHAMLYVVKGRQLDVLGYLPGDLLIVDHGQKDAANGDIVLAQLYDADSGEGETVLRLYEPPQLRTYSTDPSLRATDTVGDHAVIMGVVKHSLRLGNAE